MSDSARTAVRWALYGLAVHVVLAGLFLVRYDGNAQWFVHFGKEGSVLPVARSSSGRRSSRVSQLLGGPGCHSDGYRGGEAARSRESCGEESERSFHHGFFSLRDTGRPQTANLCHPELDQMPSARSSTLPAVTVFPVAGGVPGSM